MTKKESPKVAVLGSLHMDLVTDTEKIPEIGETVWGGTFNMKPGGKGANQAIASARLGSEVIFIGKVGDDQFGRTILKNIEGEEIDSSFIGIDKESVTGTASIIVDSRGSNLIAVAPGADANLNVQDVMEAKKGFQKAGVLLVQLEIPIEMVRRGIEIASDQGLKTILDPAPARELPEGLLEKVDVLVPNEIEVRDLAGMDRKSATVKESAKRMLAKGTKAVVVTLGKEGSLVITRDETIKVESVEVRAVDATGAGDAFCGCLAHCLASGKSLKEAVRISNLAGAISTRKLGAQEALPTWKELSRKM